MKRTLYIAFLLLFGVVSFAQQPTQHAFAGTFNVITYSSSTVSDFYVNGFFNDVKNDYAEAGITAGFILWDVLGNRFLIDSVEHGSVTYLHVTDLNSAGMVNTGIGAIIQEDNGCPFYVAGVSDELNNRIGEHAAQVCGGGSSVVDSTRLVQDSILVYYQDGTEIGRDTIPVSLGGIGSGMDIDSTRLVQDSLLLYYQSGVEVGRDTIRPYNGDNSQGNELITSTLVRSDSVFVIEAGTEHYTGVNTPNTDSQTLSTDGTSGNISISGGNSITISVDDADADATNELNTSANLTGTNLNITDAGGTLTIDMSSLVNDADADPTNEYNTSAMLSGTNLNITDGGGTLTVDLSSLEESQAIIDTATAIEARRVKQLNDLLDVTLTSPTDGQVLKYDAVSGLWVNGTDNTGGGGSTAYQIAILADYTALSSATITDSLIFITNENYGGLFQRYFGTDAVDDGVIVQDAAGTKFERVRDDKSYYRVSWWDETAYNGSEIFQKIFTSRPDGGITIDISNQNSPRAIEFDRDVDLVPELTIVGKGDTLRRAATPVTTLTANEAIGSTVIDVVDATGFKAGQYLFITFAGPNSRSNGYNINTPKKIVSTTSATITIQGSGLDVAASAGDTAFVVSTFFVNGNALTLGDIEFRNVVVDGNNDQNPYTNDWVVNNTIRLANQSGSFMRFYGVEFYDTPSENVICASLDARNIRAENLQGSVFHGSVILDTAVVFSIENLWANNICKATNAITGHSEAAIVTSANPSNFKIKNVQIYNCREAGVGDLGGSTDYYMIENCKFVNCKTGVFGSAGSTTEYIRNLRIVNTEFINCNEVGWDGGDLKGGNYCKDCVISDNVFVNTGLNIDGAKDCIISGNEFRYSAADGGFSTWSDFADTLNYDAMLFATEFQNLTISNNTFIGDDAYNDTLRRAIAFDVAGIVMNADADFVACTDLKVVGNNVRDFQHGIVSHPYDIWIPQGASRQYVGWLFSDNVVTMLDDHITGQKAGIVAMPGVVVDGNLIVAADDTVTTTSYPLLLYGIHGTVSNARQERLIGSIATNNTITGVNRSGAVSIFCGGNTTGNNHSRYNIVCLHNTVYSNLSGNGLDTGSGGHITDNAVYTTALPLLINQSSIPHESY